MKKREKKWITLLKGVILFLFLFGISVNAILLFRPLYVMDVEREHLSEQYGYSKEQILENYDILIRYNMLWGPKKLTFDGLPMSKEAEIHFEEVKALFGTIQKLFCLSVLFLPWIVCDLRKRKYSRCFGTALLMVLILGLILGIWIWMDWENAFTTFHKIVFRNDYWLFDPATDPIIDLLPDVFFEHCAVGILGIMAAGCGVFAFIDRKVKQYEKRNKRL